jgi:hypothetical protein
MTLIMSVVAVLVVALFLVVLCGMVLRPICLLQLRFRLQMSRRVTIVVSVRQGVSLVLER